MNWQPIATAPKEKRVLLLARYTDEYRQRLSKSDLWDVWTGKIAKDGTPWPETVTHRDWFNIAGWQHFPAFPNEQ